MDREGGEGSRSHIAVRKSYSMCDQITALWEGGEGEGEGGGGKGEGRRTTSQYNLTVSHTPLSHA